MQLNGELLFTALLTIIIELPLFYACGYQSRRQLIYFFFANLTSNLLLNEALGNLPLSIPYYPALCLGEVLVVVYEVAFMLYAVETDLRRLVKAVCCCNALSLAIGLVLIYWLEH